MAMRKDAADRRYDTYGKDNEASVEAAPTFRFVGGLVKSSAQTFSDGDAATLSFDTKGRLRTILEGATFTVTGSDLEIDVSAFRGTGGVNDRMDAWLFTADEDLSAVTEKWQGFGGWDETADLFRVLPIPTDDAAMPATPQFIPVGGEYRATPTAYADGDATILQTDVAGRLIIQNPGTGSTVSTTTLTWTATAISDANAPDSDTSIPITGAKAVYVQFNTTPAITGAPNFDLHIISSHDGTTFTTANYVTPFSAQAINIIDGAGITESPHSIKLRLDVNNANIAGGETVVAKVYVVF